MPHLDALKDIKDAKKEPNPKKKKETSQKLKNLLELRIKRMKLLDDNIRILRVDGEKSAVFECIHCGQRSKRKRRLFISHILPTHIRKAGNKHEKNKRRKNRVKVVVKSSVQKTFICSNMYCSRKFTSRYARKRHILVVHRKTMKFKCTMCDKGFRDKFNLGRHEERKHKKVFNFNCILCMYKTTKKYNLKRHCEAYHSEAGACERLGYLVCDICGKLYSSKHSLSQHKEVHDAISIGFSCSVCNCIRTENHHCMFKCRKCACVFTSKVLLKSHENIHLKVENVCNAVSNLEGHVNVKQQLMGIKFD